MQQEDNQNQSFQAPQPPIINQPVSAPEPQQPLEDRQAQMRSSIPSVYAGFWVRFAAFQVDIFLMSIIISPFGYALGKNLLSYGNGGILNLIALLFYLLLSVFLITRFGATPGKLLFGLKVIDKEGSKPALGNAILREIVGKIFSFIILGFGFLWIAFDKEKQGLHDKIVSSHVLIVKPLNLFKKILIWIIAILPVLVIPLLGIIATGVLVAINPVARQKEARDSVRKSDINIVISSSLISYRGTHGRFPNNLEELTSIGLKTIPTDPMGKSYVYLVSGDGSSAIIYAETESKPGGWCWQSSSQETEQVSSVSGCQP